MKQLSEFIQEKLHVSQYKKEKEGDSVIEDKNHYVMSLIEEEHLKNRTHDIFTSDPQRKRCLR